MNRPQPIPEILQLQEELAGVRQQALLASRNGDIFKLAKLDNRALELNKQIFNIKSQLGELRERVYGI